MLVGNSALRRLSAMGAGVLEQWARAAASVGPLPASYGTPTEADAAALRRVCGEGGVVWWGDGADAQGELRARSRDWTGKWEGGAKLLVRPASTAQVSRVMQHCFARDLAVTPTGGNTGLVAGAVPRLGAGAADAVGAASGRALRGGPEVLLSLERMRAVRTFDEGAGALAADAGLVLQQADAYLRERGFCFPMDLGARGSCQLGGNVATHAGGMNLLRWGPLRGALLGLEVVLADGTVLDMMSTLRKDNMGPSLAQLFVGSEGCLGVITGASFSVPRAPSSRSVVLFGAGSFEACVGILQRARRDLGEVLSACEFWDGPAMRLVLSSPAAAARHLQDPMDEVYPFYVLVEAQGARPAHDAEKMEALMSDALASGLAVHGVFADSPARAKDLMALRESITLALGQRGAAHKYDCSLPVEHMYSFVDRTRAHLAAALPAAFRVHAEQVDAPRAPGRRRPAPLDPAHGDFHAPGVFVVGYGHLGDANLHLNVSLPAHDDAASHAVHAAIEPWLLREIVAARGSISAEHGLGLAKGGYLHWARPAPVVHLLRAIKRSIDPRGLLNPGKGIDAPDVPLALPDGGSA
jgi:FAD/FMN-containing dehydrogenase